MNEMNPASPADDELFDRLVDGELSESERRALLSELDNRSDGWRKCALAFLEAQAWRGAMGQHVADRDPAGKIASSIQSRRWWQTASKVSLAMAASFFVAFALGLWWRGAGNELNLSDPSAVAVRSGPQDLTSPQDLAAPEISPDVTEMLVLKVPGDAPGTEKTIEVPLVNADQVDESWLSNSQPVLPTQLVQALEQSGHRVQQHRQLLPIDLQNGRRAVLPVDQIEVHYVGDRQYQ